MKVLLLGATGNVGSRLIPALLAHQHQVVAYVRSASKLPTSAISQLSAVVEGSGTDSAGIKAAILQENCDAVINAAGLAAMTSWHKPSQLPEIFAAVVKATVVMESQTDQTGQARTSSINAHTVQLVLLFSLQS
jgi:nucleoside-diphosphate-sugar epimerase